MSATIIDGKAYAEGLRGRIAGAVRALAGQGVAPGLDRKSTRLNSSHT